MSHDKCQLGLIETVHEFVQTEADESPVTDLMFPSER